MVHGQFIYLHEANLKYCICSSSVSCYKWILGDNCDPMPSSRLLLRDRARSIMDQSLVVATTGSVSFRSPNFNFPESQQQYYNKMLCVYNISVEGCDNSTLTVKSTSDDHSLFDDGRDYLFFDFGLVTLSVNGSDIGVFSETVHTTSFTTVLWSDATPGTDSGQFEIQAICNEKIELEDIHELD